MLKKGERTLTYGFDYALVRDQRLTLVPLTKTSGGTQIYGLAGRQSQSQHTFTNSPSTTGSGTTSPSVSACRW